MHKTMKRFSACAAIAVLSASASVQAAEFDARGQLSVEPDNLVYNFDAPSADDAGVELLAYNPRNRQLGITAADFDSDTDGLEGGGAMLVGGEFSDLLVRLPATWESYRGRRVEMKMWYQPKGTDVRATITWLLGDADGFLEGTNQAIAFAGSVSFHPTGRATSDGWIEVSTGPFDVEMAGLAPAWISIEDTQHLQGYQLPYDESARAKLDALEIVDLGAAAVPDVTCKAAEEEQTCGQSGVCLYARCVDAAAVLGSIPQGQVGQDYVQRRLSELDDYMGPRLGRMMLPTVRQRLEAAITQGARQFWKEFRLAHELLLDGHGSPPSASNLFVYNNSGICLGPGVADLLPRGADLPADARPQPIVFSADASFPQGAMLERGDALASIDGLDVWEWVDANQRRFYYNGDPRGRDAILTNSIIEAAKTAGAQLTFERCVSPGAEGVCGPEGIEEVVVDFGVGWGDEIWAGRPPMDFFDYTPRGCDMRFEQAVNVPPTGWAYYFAGWRDFEDVRHVLINGVPSQYDRNGSQWHSQLDAAFGTGPALVLLDQRTGHGGTFDGVARVIGHLFEPGNQANTVLFPWIEGGISPEMEQAFYSCNERFGTGQGCGRFYRETPTDILRPAGSSSSKLAVLNGHDVSGNDYLSRFLAYRAAPTKIFGYGPAIGAYGESCQFATYLWETSTMAYQCHDSKFFAGGEMVSEGFESGIGVMPDELVYQKQSDAVAGRDTMLEAARAWLKTP